MITRRLALAGAITLPAAPGLRAHAADTPGVTATEIKIGNTMPYGGPASAYGSIGKADAAFFQWLNEQGGIAGRRINFISLDDGYSPPRTVEQTRRLVEDEKVAFMFDALGTPTNSAVHRYLNQKKVPQLFVKMGIPFPPPAHARVPAEPQSGPTNSFGRCKCWVLILADRGWPGVRGVKGIPIWQKMTAAEPPTRHLSAHGFSAPYISSSICSLMTSEPLAKLSGA